MPGTVSDLMCQGLTCVLILVLARFCADSQYESCISPWCARCTTVPGTVSDLMCQGLTCVLIPVLARVCADSQHCLDMSPSCAKGRDLTLDLVRRRSDAGEHSKARPRPTPPAVRVNTVSGTASQLARQAITRDSQGSFVATHVTTPLPRRPARVSQPMPFSLSPRPRCTAGGHCAPIASNHESAASEA